MDMKESEIKSMVFDLVQAIERSDYKTVEKYFANDIKNYVTNKEGGINLVVGAQEYINALQSMNFRKVKPTLSITQIHVISNNQAMFMLEVNARKLDKTLHNFATFLIDIEGTKIVTMRMVEALPRYSDQFWNDY